MSKNGSNFQRAQFPVLRNSSRSVIPNLVKNIIILYCIFCHFNINWFLVKSNMMVTKLLVKIKLFLFGMSKRSADIQILITEANIYVYGLRETFAYLVS